MRNWVWMWVLLCLVLGCAADMQAQAKPAANDRLTFTNGDQLTGSLQRADSKGVVFASTMAKNVTVPWKNIRELHTGTAFVVLTADGKMYRGMLLVQNGNVIVLSAVASVPSEVVPAGAVRMVVTPKLYKSAVTARPRLWQSWRGQLVGGFSRVSATQDSTSYTTQIALQRPVPELGWMQQKSNTQFSFQSSYGKLSQPNTPTVRTSIFTAALEQDEDLNAKLFLFANAELDHNDAQGLQLQQAYGGGIGWKVKDTAATQLALKADLHWTRQEFLSAANERFLATSLTETLRQQLRKIIWTQSVSITPSITKGVAYQMSGMSAWALPVYKMLSLNFTIVDNYLNNPQPGFLKNSLQYSTGIQVSLH
ncbi:MAG: DUF481 domain-containing protein [Terriglobales bacterium]